MNNFLKRERQSRQNAARDISRSRFTISATFMSTISYNNMLLLLSIIKNSGLTKKKEYFFVIL